MSSNDSFKDDEEEEDVEQTRLRGSRRGAGGPSPASKGRAEGDDDACVSVTDWTKKRRKSDFKEITQEKG